MKNLKNIFSNKKLSVYHFLLLFFVYPLCILAVIPKKQANKKPNRPAARPARKADNNQSGNSILVRGLDSINVVGSIEKQGKASQEKKAELKSLYEDKKYFTQSLIIKNTDLSYTLDKIMTDESVKVTTARNSNNLTSEESEKYASIDMLDVIKNLREYNNILTQILPKLLIDALHNFLEVDETARSQSPNKNEKNLKNISTDSVISHVMNVINKKINSQSGDKRFRGIEIQKEVAYLYSTLNIVMNESIDLSNEEKGAIVNILNTALFDSIKTSLQSFLNTLFNNLPYITVESLKRYVKSIESFYARLYSNNSAVGEVEGGFTYRGAVPFELFENLDNALADMSSPSDKMNYCNSIFYLLLMHFFLLQEKSAKGLKSLLMPLIQLNPLFMFDFQQFNEVDEKGFSKNNNYDFAKNKEALNSVFFNVVEDNKTMLKEAVAVMRAYLGKKVLYQLVYHPLTLNNDNDSQGGKVTINGVNRIIDIYELLSYLFIALKEEEQSNVVLFPNNLEEITGSVRTGQYVGKNISSLLCVLFAKYDMEVLRDSHLLNLEDGSKGVKDFLIDFLNSPYKKGGDDLLGMIKNKVAGGAREVKSMVHMINKWFFILKNLHLFTSISEDIVGLFGQKTPMWKKVWSDDKSFLNQNGLQYGQVAMFNILANSVRVLLSTMMCVSMLGQEVFDSNAQIKDNNMVQIHAYPAYLLEVQKDLLQKSGMTSNNNPGYNFLNFIFNRLFPDIQRQRFMSGTSVQNTMSEMIEKKYKNNDQNDGDKNQDTIKKFITGKITMPTEFSNSMYYSGALLGLFRVTKNKENNPKMQYYSKIINDLAPNLEATIRSIENKLIPIG